MDGKPLLLIDVDGVLAPYGCRVAPPGYRRAGTPLVDWLHDDHGAWLGELSEVFELCWATGWEHAANAGNGPALGLPMLPVIEFNHGCIRRFRADDDVTWKLPDVAAYVGTRPFAWIDDDLGADARAWAARRNAEGGHALVLSIRPEVGLRRDDVATLLAFAADVAAEPDAA